MKQFYSSKGVNASNPNRAKVTINTIQKLYKSKEPITVLTAHDYPTGLFVEKAGIEICLVGDSLGMVALGYQNTSPITMEEMLHHCRAVTRGAKSSFLVGDMPFGSYETSPTNALKNAIRFVKEGNMEGVKLEGGSEMLETIQKITRIGIPVMGHIGLTPQRQSSLGGYKLQGNTADKAKKLIEDAKSLQEAGCFAIVLEAIPEPIATCVTKILRIPTIGIGAGAGTNGQVLVQQDMLGIFDRFMPRFCKHYAKLDKIVTDAIKTYREEVKTGVFPAKEHSYPMEKEEYEKFIQFINENETSSLDK
ncbi:ketopantoate hydroxymethyltransferase [Rhizophagus irregularis]|nr:ketopantoate hydroxymethyltransferase [Rhizophagus irregularis]GBC40154.1 ketopantoate hydroxymethyltransferase [Rhizophagus irregularis DAOM 181602=DAOM 197198]PKC74045.1 ketopantoate hydroxymethyltransferase [Rhizophagus irregularis]PKK79184.1 ketopantoate hydroxymethyltransferase [Rhizophagus irregularis]PKY17731.1 ketopantoate hydroxymethyltransferase [Rhizophagus irregularis]